jgi:erythromycin esterase
MIQFFAETGIARTVVFEGPWPEFLRVNDYIHDGDGDPRELMKTDYYFFWEYEEMIDLIEWARAFNSTRAADEQIEFLGFDVLTADTRDAADLVIAYLGSVDSAARSAAVNSYQCVPGSIETTTCGQNVTNVRAGIEQNREAYEASSSTREYLRALQSARVVESTNQYLRTPGGERDPWRDTVLAEYAGWFAEEWTGEERLVLWAHNEHIGTLPAAGQWKSLGQHLQDRYGERYFSIGTCMLSGSLARSNGQEVTVAEMQPPIETNYELQFAKGGFRYFLIPLFMPDVPTWLTGPANLRFGTASYDPKPNFLDFTNPAYSLPNKFDAIIFIKETTPCTPIDAAGTNGRRRLLHHFPQ